MKIVFVLFLFISTMGLSQFSPIWEVNNNFFQFEVRAFDMNDSGEILLISDQYDGGPTSNLMAYSSSDYGQTWDSTLFQNFAMMKDNAVITEGGNRFFTSIQNVYPAVGSPYQRKVIHSSLDGGISWSEKTLDSIVVGANFSRSIAFLNDSTGMFFYNGGKFLTKDYGYSWQKLNNSGAEHIGVLDDRFIFYWYSSVMTINPYSNQIDSMEYSPFSVGSVRQSSFKNNTVCRGIRSQDGNLYGSEYNHNFAAVNIDVLPLGNQHVIHFPQRYALVDLKLSENCIHLALDGRYTKSCDGGITFHDFDAFNGNMNEEVFFIDFVNDTLGFLVSKNLITYEWRVWKTTNGGGSNLNQVLTNQSLAGINQMEDDLHFDVYPNPASEEINIQSEEEIVKVEVCSMDGKVVLVEEIGSTSGKLVISQLSVGTYVLKVFTANAVGVSRIVRE